MSKKISSNKLTIFLLKNNYKDSEIIIDYDNYSTLDSSSSISNEEGCKKIKFPDHTIYLKKYKNKPKKILQNFYDNQLNIIDSENTNFSIADIYTIKYRNEEIRFVITFGLSKIINKESIIERFGLKTLLSLYNKDDKDSFSFKEISTKNISKQCKTTIQHLSRFEEDIKEFDISKNTDILKGLIGHVKILADEKDIKEIQDIMSGDNSENNIISIIKEKRTIVGSDSLSLKINFNHVSIKNLLILLYKTYITNNYKKNDFEWIDNINEVKDNNVIGKLNSQLVIEINSTMSDIWISIPYELFHSDIDKISYLNKKHKEETCDINLSKYKIIKNCSLNLVDLNNDKIYFFNIDNELIGIYCIYDLLYAEIDYDSNTYILNNQTWYIVNKDFKIEVENFYINVKSSDIKLPDNFYKREDEYNANISDVNFINMDKKIITIDKNDKFELCDLLTSNKELIHIKKYGSSSKLSYLFLQGLRSINGIRNMKNLDSINAKINNEKFKLMENDKYKIIFAIITSSKEDKPKLPFFAKSCFKNVADELDRLRIDFYIKTINDEYK